MDPEDELKAENEVLRLRLELEHGMVMEDHGTLSIEAENQWLQQVYDFEQQWRDVPRVKVYDFIGSPDFVPLSELQGHEMKDALKNIELILEEKGIALDRGSKYDDAVIYQFITEELFQYEMDGMSVEGMMHHFIYEEFHPDHDDDIRRIVTDFVKSIFRKAWNEEFDALHLAETVSLNGKKYNSSGISSVILVFQEAHRSFVMEHFTIEEVTMNAEAGEGMVKAKLAYTRESLQGELVQQEEECTFRVVMENGYWNIALFKLPGL